MARTVTQIKQTMLDAKAGESALSGLTSTSQTALWNLYFFIVASCIAIFEQLMDLFKADLEVLASEAIPNTPQWIRKKVLEFQTGYVASLNTTTFVVEYPNVVTTAQIITRCSVVTQNNKNVLIKVAKSEPPVQLSSGEESELEAYIGTWFSAGVRSVIINQPSDKLEIVADIYYNGQYSLTMSDLVSSALTTYMANLPFNGIISNQAIIDTIQAVDGVKYVKLTQVLVRRNSVSYGSGVTLYNLATGVDAVSYQTYAGYVEQETTSGHTFTDTLTFIVAQ